MSGPGGVVARTDYDGADQATASWTQTSGGTVLSQADYAYNKVGAPLAELDELDRFALARYGATVAVAVTGIAGPSGGTPEKPVGTVWLGWKRRGGYAQTELFHFDGDRESVRRQTLAAALRGVQKILTS